MAALRNYRAGARAFAQLARPGGRTRCDLILTPGARSQGGLSLCVCVCVLDFPQGLPAGLTRRRQYRRVVLQSSSDTLWRSR
jgi:hypothetical protein